MAERAQSEALGFVAVFAVVLLTITLLSTTGFAGLESQRGFVQTNNAQRALSVLADNVEDVTLDGARSRTTAVKLADASLSLGETTTVTVRGERTTDPSENFTRSYTIHPIVYDSGDGSRIVYSVGSLIRDDRAAAVMVRRPDFVLTEDAVVVPLVRTYPSGVKQTGGSTTVGVRTTARNRWIIRTNSTEYDLTLNVTSSRAGAWQRYLGSFSATSCARTGDTVSCTVTTDHVAIAGTDVSVSFGSKPGS